MGAVSITCTLAKPRSYSAVLVLFPFFVLVPHPHVTSLRFDVHQSFVKEAKGTLLLLYVLYDCVTLVNWFLRMIPLRCVCQLVSAH